ncbi:MAG: serine hydrolase, partial [Cyanobacteria bacterium J06641_5]
QPSLDGHKIEQLHDTSWIDWLEAGRLQDADAELQRALHDAIATSSNDATSLLVDVLTGTTSGPVLPAAEFECWQQRRHSINRFFQTWGWPELDGINVSQKTWSDDYYGRERTFVGPHYEDRNRLSTAAVARVLLAIARTEILTPARCQAMLALLRRSPQAPLAPEEEENQVDGFLGAGLPAGSRLYSKAGWTSWARHDAAYIELPEAVPPYVLVVFSERERGEPPQRELLPFVSAEIATAWSTLNKNC